MVIQQQFVAGSTQPATGTTLALPAIVAANAIQQQPAASQAAAAYSPQDNYYQQQLLKSAQQQYSTLPRLNGLGTAPHQYATQQDSPNSTTNHLIATSQQANGDLYNRTPTYAPKPTYYATQQQAYSTGRTQMQQQPAYYATKQQHSPAGLQRPTSNGLSVRQLPMIMTQSVANLSPQQSQLIAQQQQQQEQQQRQQQMQQLIMSYQQQQQLGALQTADLISQQQSPYVHNEHLLQQSVSQQQHVDVRWTQIQDEQRQINQHQRHLYTQQQQQLPAPISERLVGGSRANRFSDRDSVSTVSRFNQFDEGRSITMRSQYTSANNSLKTTRNFGFLKLTTAALRHLIGMSFTTPANEKHNLHQNLNLSVTDNNTNNNKRSSHINGSSNNNNNTSTSVKVTVIDSAEDHYFKRQVFKHQLTIMRVINLLSAAFVLLSPIAMLLVPKMESVFNGPSQDYSSENSQNLPSNSEQNVGTSNQSPAPSITHAVGLTGKQAFGQRQPPYFIPQPQWRISECNSDCDGLLIGFVVRIIMLCIAYWAIFLRTQTASLPRIDFQRCLLSSMAVLVTLAYWLFFIFRLFDKRFNDFELQYISIVQFALSMLESLILLHYLAVVLLELRGRKKVYCIKVVRSPDGASQYYSCGALSIQKCAQFVLEKYHRQFKQYGPYTEQLLHLEDRLAQNSAPGHRDEQSGQERSRADSPAHSQSEVRSSRRSTSRASRHHSRNTTHSPSRSPVRERSRSQRKFADTSRGSNQAVKLYQVDLDPPENNNDEVNQSPTTNDSKEITNLEKANQGSKGDETKQNEHDSNSANQSSDTTSCMKESSLETIRAANSISDLLTQQKSSSSSSKALNQRRKNEDQLATSQQNQSSRDETESVRSVRSRRSTNKSHHRHHHHRERSSSRANDIQDDYRPSTSLNIPQSDPLDDHERKLRRRKFRLLIAVQEAFGHIKRIDEDHPVEVNGQHLDNRQALGPNQAARSLYPSIARTLQKYLRLTRQTGRHNLQSIYEHLSKCLLYKLSPRAFLEKFINQDPVWQQSETNLFANCSLQDSMLMCPRKKSNDLEINSWSLICDTLLSRQIDSGTFFVLKQGQVSLLVTIAKMPLLSLSEEVIDQNKCKFSFASSSESSA